MDSLNVLALTGTLERAPVLRQEEGGTAPRCSATLRCEEVSASGSPFKLYVPLEAWGKSAEALGALPAGTAVAIQGKLCWRKHVPRPGEDKSGLAVLVGKVSVLASPEVPA